jgi:hypothetical protein
MAGVMVTSARCLVVGKRHREHRLDAGLLDADDSGGFGGRDRQRKATFDLIPYGGGRWGSGDGKVQALGLAWRQPGDNLERDRRFARMERRARRQQIATDIARGDQRQRRVVRYGAFDSE